MSQVAQPPSMKSTACRRFWPTGRHIGQFLFSCCSHATPRRFAIAFNVFFSGRPWPRNLGLSGPARRYVGDGPPYRRRLRWCSSRHIVPDDAGRLERNAGAICRPVAWQTRRKGKRPGRRLCRSGGSGPRRQGCEATGWLSRAWAASSSNGAPASRNRLACPIFKTRETIRA